MLDQQDRAGQSMHYRITIRLVKVAELATTRAIPAPDTLRQTNSYQQGRPGFNEVLLLIEIILFRLTRSTLFSKTQTWKKYWLLWITSFWRFWNSNRDGMVGAWEENHGWLPKEERGAFVVLSWAQAHVNRWGFLITELEMRQKENPWNSL